MQPFSYQRATSIEMAIETVARHPGAAFLAGGTNLIDLMKLGVAAPQHLIDISRLPLTSIEEHTAGVRIGALVRNSDLAEHPLIRERYPLIVEALHAGASAQLRNMATVGGNVLQRTRCAYFNDISTPCNKRSPGSGCAALHGENRMHAILGSSENCIATHPSDLCVALVALDAMIQIQGPHGARSIPLTDFYLLPGETPERENVLEHGELIVAVELSVLPRAMRAHYIKVRDRASYAFALVSVAAVLEINDGRIRSARLACGGVATRPWRLHEAEALLIDAVPMVETYAAVANIAVREAVPRQKNGFKVELLKRTLIQTLSLVGGNA